MCRVWTNETEPGRWGSISYPRVGTIRRDTSLTLRQRVTANTLTDRTGNIVRSTSTWVSDLARLQAVSERPGVTVAASACPGVEVLQRE